MVLDKICVEMNHRFGESTIEIWTCFLCLHPKNNNFSRFHIDSLVRVAQIYDVDFYTSINIPGVYSENYQKLI
jgi:hypothetical protein